MTRCPSRARLTALALVASTTMLCSGCAISAMTPPPTNYNVEKAPSCTESSGSIGLDIIWGLIWGVPSIAAFGEDEAGLGLLFALGAGVHIASAVTGAKWGGRCKKARKQHDRWLVDQQDLLRQQRRANRRLRARKAQAPPPDAAAAAEPAAATGAATPGAAPAPATDPNTVKPGAAAAPKAAPKTARPAPTTTRAPAKAPIPVAPRTKRPRNHDPWAEFWREVAP
jgi:hypothetical protein